MKVHVMADAEDQVLAPAIERVAVALQSDPQLWSAHATIEFVPADGVIVLLHDHDWDDIRDIAHLLRVDERPVRARRLSDGGDRLVVYFSDGLDRYHGGIDITWFVDETVARMALGINLTLIFP